MADLAYPSNYVEASSTLSHHAAAERLGLLPRLIAVRESRSRLLENGTGRRIVDLDRSACRALTGDASLPDRSTGGA
jgi:hypothetical protein